MMPKPRVVAIGGGTGLSTLLRGLKHYPVSLSGIVTMTDNGESSGRLSREMGVLPPGDVRKCLAALANDEQLLTKLFEYRFDKGRGLNGHSLGNLLLLALSDITGDFESAVQASSQILSIKGQVIPSTLEHVSLVGQLKNGQQALGEADIAVQGHRFGIAEVSLLPKNIKANPTAVHFVSNADLLLVGPGSLYTSVIPNFLIKEFREAFKNSPALKIYVCNASTERGETEKFSVEDHLAEVLNYAGKNGFDACLVNNKIITDDETIQNITTEAAEAHGVPLVKADLIDKAMPLYHESRKLAEAIWQIFTGGAKALAQVSDRSTSRSRK